MRCFERSNSLFAGHSWERIQEVVKTVITGQIVDEITKGHSCAHKDRRTAKDVRIAVNNGDGARHGTLFVDSIAIPVRPNGAKSTPACRAARTNPLAALRHH
jgi:hypothetical protein